MPAATTPTALVSARGTANIDTDPATRTALLRFCASGDTHLRDELVKRYERVVQWVVGRQSREPGHTDDLMQVGRMALVQALERYEPSRGVRFTSYAIKIISGTLKHHYRDKVAFIRVPRPLHELSMELPRIQEKLTIHLGRLPNDHEVADFAKVPVSEVYRAQRVGEAYKLQSLDEALDSGSVAETHGAADKDIEAMVEFAPLHTAINRLEERQQIIVRRRYFDLWSQSRVALSLGISQMHVSRLERAGLRKLRGYLGADGTGFHAMAN
jgi:RNA polymerase sigma-B factor